MLDALNTPIISKDTSRLALRHDHAQLRRAENLPNPWAAEHTVYYPIAVGPDADNRGDGGWYRTTVTGCAEEEVDPNPECPGSGSLGSLFAGLHHFPPGHVLGSAAGSMCGHHS